MIYKETRRWKITTLNDHAITRPRNTMAHRTINIESFFATKNQFFGNFHGESFVIRRFGLSDGHRFFGRIKIFPSSSGAALLKTRI